MDRKPRSIIPSEWHVPDYDCYEFQSVRERYALCVFVLNENGRLQRQLDRMVPWLGQVDLIIADGGSTDGCAEPDELRRRGVHSLLVKRGPGRLSAQMRMALAHCIQSGYRGVIVMDGNDKDDPSAIPRFVGALDNGYDHVQGSRFVRGGKAVRTPKSRYYAIRCLHAPLMSLCAGFQYTDTTNGFRAYSSRFLLDHRVLPFRDEFSAYELHYYLALRAPHLGYRCCEIPVTRAYPKDGAVPTKIHGWRGNAKVRRTLFAACMGWYVPPARRAG
jgi:glycosyltransferase involved in cell wall biosynthesis